MRALILGMDAAIDVQREVESNHYGDIHETIQYNQWRIARSGENILWGQGILWLDLVNAEDENYTVEVGDTVAWDDFDRNVYVLLASGTVGDDGEYAIAPGTVVGMAMGELYRKMIPSATPDITAVRATEFEDIQSAIIET